MSTVTIRKETENLNSIENIELWQGRIKSHLEWLGEHWNGWESWKASYLLDRAIHWGEAKALKSKSQDLNAEVSVPVIANHIRNLMPFLFSKNPVFYGIPKNSDDPTSISNTKAQVDYLNNEWEEQDMSRQIKRSILDAAIIGHGIAEVGWGIDLELPKTDQPEKKGNINYLDYINEEHPFIRRVNPFLFLFDRMSPDSDLSSARWCCKLVIQTVQDLLDNDLYDKTVRNKIAEGKIPIMKVVEFNRKYHPSDDEDGMDFLFKEPGKIGDHALENPDTLCMIYKVYDRKFGQVFALIPGHNEDVLMKDSWDNRYSHLKNFPFLKVDFEEVPNEPYGVGHTRYLADIQHQKNRNRSKVYAITRMFNPKFVHEGSQPLDTDEEEKIKLDHPGVVVNLKPGSAIKEFPIPRLTEDIYRADNLLDQDYSEVSGEDVLARGGLLPSRTSAEEIRERRRLRGLRLETNVENTHKFILSAANQILANAKRYISKNKVVEVVGRSGEFWNRISPEQIREGDTKLKLELVSKDPEPPEMKRRTLMELFTIISNPNIYQLLQSQGVQVNMKRLWRLLMETYGESELQHVFPNLTEPMQLPDIDLQNTGNPPGQGPQSPESTRQIQSDNVSPNSQGQGLEGIFGNLTPTRF